MGDNVQHIDGETTEVGKTASMLVGDLQTVMDDYGGNINNAEALGALLIVLYNTLLLSHEDEDDGPA